MKLATLKMHSGPLENCGFPAISACQQHQAENNHYTLKVRHTPQVPAHLYPLEGIRAGVTPGLPCMNPFPYVDQWNRVPEPPPSPP